MSNWSPTSYIDAALTALLNEPLSAEAVADKIVEECTAAVRSATAEADQDNEDTPGLESFLWGFWCEFHKIAQEDTTTHRRLGQVLVALKVKGDESCKGWQVWGSPISWSDLPIFGATARECIDSVWFLSMLTDWHVDLYVLLSRTGSLGQRSATKYVRSPDASHRQPPVRQPRRSGNRAGN